MTDARPVPAEAFGLLGDETRLGIVMELAAHRWPGWELRGLPFATLRRAVGVDDAGKFNYHLGRLEGTFVVNVDGEYCLTNAGLRVAGLVASGQVPGDDLRRRATLDLTCGCGQPLTATYEHNWLRLECPDHGVVFGSSLPQAAVRDRSFEDVVALATHRTRVDVERALAGACPHCWGPVDSTCPVDPPWLDDSPVDGPFVEFDCSSCGLRFAVPPGVCVRSHPAVVAFFHDHGVDLRDRTYFDLPFVAPDRATVTGEDPPRVELPIECGDDELVVTLDGSAAVVAVD